MKVSGPQDYQDFLNAYADELLRWNQRINLVSRQDTENLIQDLFRQCVGGAQALLSQLNERGWLDPGTGQQSSYFDLGSGGGIPGVIWHEVFSRQFGGLQTWLVEPREKRAWFLKRLASQAPFGRFSVLEGRWGEVTVEKNTPKSDFLTIISLKALHLTDPEVISGLARAQVAGREGRLAIARYYPSGQDLDPGLVGKLLIPDPGQRVEMDHLILEAQDSRVLSWVEAGPREACLVLSLYTTVHS